jgi:hypothetical protein
MLVASSRAMLASNHLYTTPTRESRLKPGVSRGAPTTLAKLMKLASQTRLHAIVRCPYARIWAVRLVSAFH